MRGRILATAGAATLFMLAGAGCSGIDLRDENGTGISIDEDGGVSVGNGDAEVVIPGAGNASESSGGVRADGESVFTIASSGENIKEDCGDRAVNVVASDTTVVLNGSCGDVNVAGSGNEVHVGTATSVNVVGSKNLVYYASGDPRSADLGTGNVIEAGGDAAP
ncbi:DUF3060 domain-containing protein [Nocardiopsis ansamitocini]|uniref:DUF3060 domain-containing protein n=1 Tax=Nocardiopsis ansamitocini TaxID=1670832 RepID=A0A9W6P286_9ACTN|nr:DUF3060 domain-containing protein [Nocardiopsis ansamitocini]GLU45884.1 hypothetical protein Nans01_02350 [Nocardiopsis ansamitocini]